MDAVFIHCVAMHLPGMVISLLGVLKISPGALLPGFVILLLMVFSVTTMSMGGKVVQLSGLLMIFVMRSDVIASRHLSSRVQTLYAHL